MNNYIYLLISLSLPLSLASQTMNENTTNYWPDSRYEVHGDGTVTDMVTGLMWMQCSLGQNPDDNCSGDATKHDWKDALEIAKDYSLGIYSDWRLPNIKEFSSLAAHDRYSPAINITIFPNTLSDDQYWSSSPYSPLGGYARQINFIYGDDNYNKRTEPHYVRLVRSGQ